MVDEHLSNHGNGHLGAQELLPLPRRRRTRKSSPSQPATSPSTTNTPAPRRGGRRYPRRALSPPGGAAARALPGLALLPGPAPLPPPPRLPAAASRSRRPSSFPAADRGQAADSRGRLPAASPSFLSSSAAAHYYKKSFARPFQNSLGGRQPFEPPRLMLRINGGGYFLLTKAVRKKLSRKIDLWRQAT